MDPVRRAARLGGAALIVTGAGVLAAGLLTPWAWRSRDWPAVPLVVALVLLGPVTGLYQTLRHRRTDDRRPYGVAVVAALLATTAAVFGALSVDPEAGPRAGGLLTVLGCLATLVGWALIHAAGRGPVRPAGGPVAVTIAGLLALGLAAVPAMGWFTHDRFIRHSTAAPLPAVADTAPERLDRVRWRAGTDNRFRFVPAPLVSGRNLLVPAREGVQAIDAVSGRPHWSYRRADMESPDDLVLTSGGRVTVIFYLVRVAVGLDTATGRLLWERQHQALDAAPGTGDTFLTSGDIGDDTVFLTSIDGRTGDPLWTWTRSYGRDRCEVEHTLAAGEVTVLRIHCADRLGGDYDGVDEVVGLSSAHGRHLWTWRPASGEIVNSLTPLGAAGGGIWVATGGKHDAVLLDARTGRPLREHVEPKSANTRSKYNLPVFADGLAIHVGSEVTAVELVTGRVRWTSRIPALGGWSRIFALARNGTAYVLLAPGERSPDLRPHGVPLRLLVIDTADGRLRADHRLAATPCRDCSADISMLLGPGLLIIAETVSDAPTRLRAIG